MATRTVTRPTASANQGTPQAKRDWSAQVSTKGSGKPSRIIVHGVEGVGKTSFAAEAPSPLFLMTRGETGIQTLIDSGQCKETAHMPEAETWEDLISQVQWVADGEHSHKTLVIDAINGAERLCHEYETRTKYGGDWGERGFSGYQRGYESSLASWRELMFLLDKVRERGVMPFLLCHTAVKPFKNPEGEDYDRYQPDMHHKTWGLTHKWADFVGFMKFETFTEKTNNRAKGVGGQQRILCVERHAAYDAKNRLGLTEEIELGDSPKDAWNNFTSAIKAAKQSTNGKAA